MKSTVGILCERLELVELQTKKNITLITLKNNTPV